MLTANERRFFVKIRAGKSLGNCETIYYRNDLPFDVLNKWKWYYDYRAALYKVANPRHITEVSTGSYEYTPPLLERQKALKNKIRSKRGKITEYETKLRMAEQSWTILFPITEEEMYKKSVAKIKTLKGELVMMEIELSDL